MVFLRPSVGLDDDMVNIEDGQKDFGKSVYKEFSWMLEVLICQWIVIIRTSE